MKADPITTLVGALSLLLLAAAAPLPAAAHPHVWVENSATFNFDAKKRLTGITHNWEFDPMYSAAIARDYKAGKDGVFPEKQVKKMLERPFGWLAQDAYLTPVYVNGEKRFADAMTGFAPVMRGETLVCTFTVTFKKPLEPLKDKVEVAIYDPQYYYDVVFGGEPVRLSGIAPSACRWELYEDTERAEYFGLINPMTVKLCVK